MPLGFAASAGAVSDDELVRSLDWHVGHIRESWNASVESIIETGRRVQVALSELPHGEKATLWERLPFGERTGQRLVAIGLHPHISNPTHVSVLPPSWGTLYELTKLTDEQWERGVSEGLIHPGMERKHVKQLLPVERARARSADYDVSRDYCTTEDLESLVGAGFATIYADPAWQYGNQGTRGATGDHYSGMSVDEICALPVAPAAAENAHLHLWTTNAFLFDARRVIEAWGFEYKSCYVWVKPQIGMGNYWRVSHEFLLLGVRGSLSFADKSLRSWGEFRRAQHSAKPEQIRDLIHRASPGPRLEMFARRAVEGWTCWGNEIRREVFAA